MPSAEALARIEQALAVVAKLPPAETPEERLGHAIATAKALIQGLDHPPPAPAQNVAPVKILEISLVPGDKRGKTRARKRLETTDAATLLAVDESLHNLRRTHLDAGDDHRAALVKAHEVVLEEMVRRGVAHPAREAEDELDIVCKAKRRRWRQLYKRDPSPPPLPAPCASGIPRLEKREARLAIRPWTHEVKILKGVAPAAEERFVLGVVLEPETIDAQKDIYNDVEIRKAAHGFMEHYGHIGLMHKKIIDGRVKILESYLAPADFVLEGQHVKKGTWMLAARIVDDGLWKSVKDGTFNGWSIGGTAIKEPDPEHSALLALFGS